jgi:hypothetical protein
VAKTDPRMVVKEMFAAWDKKDLDGVMARYADTVVIRGPGGTRAEGADAARRMLAYFDRHAFLQQIGQL